MGVLTVLTGWKECSLLPSGMKKGSFYFAQRDRFGEKSLFTACKRVFLFFFGTFGNCVVEGQNAAFGDFSFGLDPHALARYLAYEYAPCPQTMYSEISSLPPAHYLLVHDGNVRMAPYWELPAPAACPKKEN